MTAANCTRSPQEKVCGYEYTVRRGDSFYLIANRLGVPLRDLLEANSDINPARLMVGDVLCIPMEEDDAPEPPTVPTPSTPQPPAVQPPTAQTPMVPPTAPQPSEPEPETPDAGDDLDAPATLPDSTGTPTPLPSTPDDSAMRVCPESDRYTVMQGETATDIQLRKDLNRSTLQMANPSIDLDTLQVGDTVCVPAQNVACMPSPTYILQADETLESVALKLNASLTAMLRANPCLAPSDFKAGACIWVPED